MAITEKQLGQVRPAVAGTAESLYSPGASTTGVIKSILVANTSGSTATYRIFVDDNGTTYDQDTALAYDVTLDGGEYHILSVYWPMNDATGNIAVSSSVNASINFTAFGAEIT